MDIDLDPVDLALCADLMRVTSLAYDQMARRLDVEALGGALADRLRDVITDLTLLSQELEEEARVLDIRREGAEAKLR